MNKLTVELTPQQHNAEIRCEIKFHNGRSWVGHGRDAVHMKIWGTVSTKFSLKYLHFCEETFSVHVVQYSIAWHSIA